MAEYIGREAAIKCAEESYKTWNLITAAADGAREINKCYKMQELCKTIGEVFKIVPAADVAPVVHGHWTTECYNVPICSICGTYVSKDVYNSEDSTPNFCPHCGAKMDEEEHNNV